MINNFSKKISRIQQALSNPVTLDTQGVNKKAVLVAKKNIMEIVQAEFDSEFETSFDRWFGPAGVGLIPEADAVQSVSFQFTSNESCTPLAKFVKETGSDNLSFRALLYELIQEGDRRSGDGVQISVQPVFIDGYGSPRPAIEIDLRVDWLEAHRTACR